MSKKLTEEEQITLDTYNQLAALWAGAHTSAGFWAGEIQKLKALLPKGKILEIGAGGGRDAKELIEAGYEYFGTDISDGLLAEARRHNPGAAFKRISLYDLDFKDRFDGFWCSAVLLHIPRNRINEALQAIRRSVKPGAVGFISIKEGDGEVLEQREEEQGRKRLFVFWQDEDFQRVLEDNGFEVISSKRIPVSERTKWLAYHVQTRV